MQVIVFTDPAGRLHVMRPAPWARWVHRWLPPGAQDKVICTTFTAFDQLARASKVSDPIALQVEWAETEEQFLERVRAGVPVTLEQPYVDEGGVERLMLPRGDAVRLELAFRETPSRIVDDSAIPTDRSKRDQWAVPAKREAAKNRA